MVSLGYSWQTQVLINRAEICQMAVAFPCNFNLFGFLFDFDDVFRFGISAVPWWRSKRYICGKILGAHVLVGFLQKLQNPNFLFSLCALYDPCKELYHLSKKLQAEKVRSSFWKPHWHVAHFSSILRRHFGLWKLPCSQLRRCSILQGSNTRTLNRCKTQYRWFLWCRRSLIWWFRLKLKSSLNVQEILPLKRPKSKFTLHSWFLLVLQWNEDWQVFLVRWIIAENGF